jgi:surfactin synthase thioesterase subunit
MKVIAFPFAGGNVNSFNFFKSFFKNREIEFKTIEYPGRGNRIREKFMNSLEDIVEESYNNLKKEINGEDYIIYGHSMGALIGYLVCEKIEKDSFKKPEKLVVSGRSSPDFIMTTDKLNLLPSDEFWKKIDDLGGVPPEILEEKEFMDFFEPILRSDFKNIENYTYKDTSELTIPIDVFYGEDEGKDESSFINWNKRTNKVVSFFEKKGNHFFIYEHAKSITEHIFQGFNRA